MPKVFQNKIEVLIQSMTAHPDEVIAKIIENTGIKYGALYNYRKNISQPPVEAAFKLAAFFQCTVEDMFVYVTHKSVTQNGKSKVKI